MRTRLAGMIAATAALAVVTPAAASIAKTVDVNCYPPNARSVTPTLTELAHPERCVLQGEPESEADLVQLTRAHWSGWGSASAVSEAQALNNQPGMGGPASYTIDVTLFDIRRGCHGNLFYTRARVSSRYGTGSLLLTATCKAIFNHG
jgi:hypothetical protein